MTETQVAKQDNQDVTTTRSPETEMTYIPDVDISENADLIRLWVDVPGADQSSVEVTVENNVLKVAGEARVEVPEEYELVGQEYGVGKYRRDFTLSNAVDTERIRARVQAGVLEVTIPKREEVRTRKIEIGG